MTVLALALGAFLFVVGVTHFVVPGYYERLVPEWLPKQRALVYASGVVEVAIGLGLWLEAFRTVAGGAAAALLAVYVLTHVDALVRARSDRDHVLDRPLGALARVLVNLVYLAWALAVALTA